MAHFILANSKTDSPYDGRYEDLFTEDTDAARAPVTFGHNAIRSMEMDSVQAHEVADLHPEATYRLGNPTSTSVMSSQLQQMNNIYPGVQTVGDTRMKDDGLRGVNRTKFDPKHAELYASDTTILADTISNMIAEDDSFYADAKSGILPTVVTTSNSITYDTLEFVPQQIRAVAERAPARYLGYTSITNQFAFTRRAIAIMIGAEPLDSEKGQFIFGQSVRQMANSYAQTIKFGVMYALVTCHDVSFKAMQKLGRSVSREAQELMLADEIKRWDCLKRRNGYEKLNSYIMTMMHNVHGTANTFLMTSETATFISLGQTDRTEVYKYGDRKAVSALEDSINAVKTFGQGNVFIVRAATVDPNAPRNPLQFHASIGEHNPLFDAKYGSSHDNYTTKDSCIRVYNETHDRMDEISPADSTEYCSMFDNATGEVIDGSAGPGPGDPFKGVVGHIANARNQVGRYLSHQLSASLTARTQDAAGRRNQRIGMATTLVNYFSKCTPDMECNLERAFRIFASAPTNSMTNETVQTRAVQEPDASYLDTANAGERVLNPRVDAGNVDADLGRTRVQIGEDARAARGGTAAEGQAAYDAAFAAATDPTRQFNVNPAIPIQRIILATAEALFNAPNSFHYRQMAYDVATLSMTHLARVGSIVPFAVIAQTGILSSDGSLAGIAIEGTLDERPSLPASSERAALYAYCQMARLMYELGVNADAPDNLNSLGVHCTALSPLAFLAGNRFVPCVDDGTDIRPLVHDHVRFQDAANALHGGLVLTTVADLGVLAEYFDATAANNTTRAAVLFPVFGWYYGTIMTPTVVRAVPAPINNATGQQYSLRNALGLVGDKVNWWSDVSGTPRRRDGGLAAPTLTPSSPQGDLTIADLANQIYGADNVKQYVPLLGAVANATDRLEKWMQPLIIFAGTIRFHRNVLHQALEADILLPHSFIPSRNHMDYMSLAVIKVQPGLVTGATFVKKGLFTFGDNSIKQEKVGTFSFYSRSIVKNPENVFVARDVYINGYHGGAGTRPIVLHGKHTANYKPLRRKFGDANEGGAQAPSSMEMGRDRPAMYHFAVPYEFVNVNAPTRLTLLSEESIGRRGDRSGTFARIPTLPYYNSRFRFDQNLFNSISVYGDHQYVNSKLAVNAVSCQAGQEGWDSVNQTYGNKATHVRPTGHWKVWGVGACNVRIGADTGDNAGIIAAF